MVSSRASSSGWSGTENVARNVDSLPKTVGSKQHATWIFAKGIEQLRSVLIARLAVQMQVAFDAPRCDRFGTFAKQRIAREEHKRVTIGVANEAFDLLGKCGFEFVSFRRGIGQSTDDDQFGLFLVVERAADLE